MPVLLFLLLFVHQPECGDPARESMSWRVLQGNVSAVSTDGELTLVNVVESFSHQSPPRVVRISSVDLDLPAAQPFLRKLIGKRVSVWINPEMISDEHVTGVVNLGEKDINEELLARGLGRYVAPAAYTVSDYTDCLHRIAEREARRRHRGLWKK